MPSIQLYFQLFQSASKPGAFLFIVLFYGFSYLMHSGKWHLLVFNVLWDIPWGLVVISIYSSFLTVYFLGLICELFLFYRWSSIPSLFDLLSIHTLLLQGLSLLLAMILKALGPHRYYDSDDDYSPETAPLLKNAVHPSSYVNGDPVYGSRKWCVEYQDWWQGRK